MERHCLLIFLLPSGLSCCQRDARADERLVASLRAQIDDLQAENEGLRTAHEKLLASAFDGGKAQCAEHIQCFANQPHPTYPTLTVERENRHKGHARLLNEKIEQVGALLLSCPHTHTLWFVGGVRPAMLTCPYSFSHDSCAARGRYAC